MKSGFSNVSNTGLAKSGIGGLARRLLDCYSASDPEREFFFCNILLTARKHSETTKREKLFVVTGTISLYAYMVERFNALAEEASLILGPNSMSGES